jgi:hypothetical protein
MERKISSSILKCSMVPQKETLFSLEACPSTSAMYVLARKLGGVSLS